jgi:hypothetical protein
MNTSDNSRPERGKTLVLVLTLLNTILVAAISALQVDASIRSSQANRDSQYYAIQVTGSLIQAGAQSDYDIKTFSTMLINSMESLASQYSAVQQQAAGDQQGFEAMTLESQVLQARADRAKSLSILMTDPAYAPASEQSNPDYSTYISDLYKQSNEIVLKQNVSSDAYHHWNSKSDSYVAVLTILAVAFFLLGVAQMTRPGLRLLFSIFAIVVMGIGSLWTLILLLF